MISHTPGPWHYEPANVRGFKVLIGRKHASADVLLVGAGGGNPEIVAQDKANARLIAAAPDLLATLKEIADSAGFIGSSVTPAMIERVARAAIAKAEGKA